MEFNPTEKKKPLVQMEKMRAFISKRIMEISLQPFKIIIFWKKKYCSSKRAQKIEAFAPILLCCLEEKFSAIKKRRNFRFSLFSFLTNYFPNFLSKTNGICFFFTSSALRTDKIGPYRIAEWVCFCIILSFEVSA